MPTAAGQALLDTFARVRIINLAHRDDRRREMQHELNRLGLALDGETIAFHDACRPDDAGTFPSIGARGCFVSHLTVLQQALADGVENLLILEDDLDFAKDIEARLPQALADLRGSDWRIFYGGYAVFAPPADAGPLLEAKPDDLIGATHFIAFSRPAIEAAIPYLEAMMVRPPGDPAGGPMHVDGAYSWLRKAHPALRTLVAVPVLGDQRPSRTDIHTPSFVDRIPAIRDLVGVARRLKRAIR